MKGFARNLDTYEENVEGALEDSRREDDDESDWETQQGDPEDDELPF